MGGVASTDIQHHGVLRTSNFSSHFYVAHTMVDSHQRYLPKLGKRSGSDDHTLKRSTHSWTLGETNAIQVLTVNLSFLKGLFDDSDHPIAVVAGRVSWEKPFTRRSNISVSDIGENFSSIFVGQRTTIMLYDTRSQLVGGAFETKGKVVVSVFDVGVQVHKQMRQKM